jgi:hypothetical protein
MKQQQTCALGSCAAAGSGVDHSTCADLMLSTVTVAASRHDRSRLGVIRRQRTRLLTLERAGDDNAHADPTWSMHCDSCCVWLGPPGCVSTSPGWAQLLRCGLAMSLETPRYCLHIDPDGKQVVLKLRMEAGCVCQYTI